MEKLKTSDIEKAFSLYSENGVLGINSFINAVESLSLKSEEKPLKEKEVDKIYIEIIDELDAYARRVESYYGLPQHDGHMDKLIQLIKSKLHERL